MESLLAAVVGYLWGGVPTAYILTRLLRGSDIREMGSGSVGASNVMAHLGLAQGLGLGLFDGIVKGTLPVVIAGLLGFGAWTQAAVGLGAIAGHNWSPYLRLTGGRGVATALGVYLAFILWAELLMLILVGGVWGKRLRNSLALWLAVGMALVPPVAWALGRDPVVVYTSLAVLGLVLVKRVTANWERPPAGEPLARVLWCRLVHDRDIPDRAAWVSRTPGKRPRSTGE